MKVGMVYQEKESARTAELAKGYVVKLCPVEDKVYCLKGNQTRKS